MMIAGFEVSIGASIRDRIERLLQQELDLTGRIWPSECKTQGFQGSRSVSSQAPVEKLPAESGNCSPDLLCLQSPSCEQKHSFTKEANPEWYKTREYRVWKHSGRAANQYLCLLCLYCHSDRVPA